MKLQTRDEGDDERDERGVGEHQEGGEVERPPVGRPGRPLHRRRGRSCGALLLRPRHAYHRRRGATGRQIQGEDEPSRIPPDDDDPPTDLSIFRAIETRGIAQAHYSPAPAHWTQQCARTSTSHADDRLLQRRLKPCTLIFYLYFVLFFLSLK